MNFIKLPPCTVFNPHFQPDASELFYVLGALRRLLWLGVQLGWAAVGRRRRAGLGAGRRERRQRRRRW